MFVVDVVFILMLGCTITLLTEVFGCMIAFSGLSFLSFSSSCFTFSSSIVTFSCSSPAFANCFSLVAISMSVIIFCSSCFNSLRLFKSFLKFCKSSTTLCRSVAFENCFVDAAFSTSASYSIMLFSNCARDSNSKNVPSSNLTVGAFDSSCFSTTASSFAFSSIGDSFSFSLFILF